MLPATNRLDRNGLAARELEALGDRVASIESLLADRCSPGREPSEHKLAALAATILRTRRRRERFFSGDIFAEPGWDMLLELFVCRARGVRVATTSLCLAANAPQATGLRYIARLAEERLLERSPAPEDKRMVLVEITPKGYGLMRKCLGELVAELERPAVV
jgi:hypothetical protein